MREQVSGPGAEVDEVRGSWLYHCDVNDHLDAGMMAVYEVLE